MKIYTVRHSESLHQTNHNIWDTYSNEKIPLTFLGESQAIECGYFFSNMSVNLEPTLIITSPYKRAVETAEQIIKINPSLQMVKEPLLVEQNFGMFTGLTTEQCYKKYPVLARLYDFQAKKYGDYQVTPPRGESKRDVVNRAERFIKKISPWFENHKYENLIIISHCVVSRAINKVLNNETSEWFLKLSPVRNCTVRQFSQLHDGWVDDGIVFVPKEQENNITLANPKHVKHGGGEYE